MIVSIPPKDSYLWWKPAIISLDAFIYSGLIVAAAAATLTIFKAVTVKKEDNENE